jgi:hypothetical protein
MQSGTAHIHNPDYNKSQRDSLIHNRAAAIIEGLLGEASYGDREAWEAEARNWLTENAPKTGV